MVIAADVSGVNEARESLGGQRTILSQSLI